MKRLFLPVLMAVLCSPDDSASGGDSLIPDDTSGSTDPTFDPTTADISSLMSQGQSALAILAPMSQSITDAQAKLAADQVALQQAQAAAQSQLGTVQALGHQLIQAISAQYFITSTLTGASN